MTLLTGSTFNRNSFLFDIALGKVDKHSIINIFGRNPNISMSVAEDISDIGITYVPPTAARIHGIVSTSALDTSAGTGAQTVRVVGLDTAGERINEDVVLNGAVTVLTTNLYTAINTLIVIAAGSGGVNAGVITATAESPDNTVTAQINTGNNRSLSSIFTVASNADFVLNNIYFGLNRAAGGTASIDLGIIIDAIGFPSQFRAIVGAFSNGTSFGNLGGLGIGKLGPGTRIKAIGTASANNTDAFFGYQGILVER